MENTKVRFPMPQNGSKLTGTYLSKVYAFEMTKSKFNDKDQICWHFVTKQQAKFDLYMTIDNKTHVDQFLNAGILKPIGSEEYEIVEMGLQPKLWVSLQGGKLQSFVPYRPEGD